MKKLDAKIARKLVKSYREPTEINGILKIIEVMAKSGFYNITFAFPRTRPGATKAVNIRDKLDKLGFNVAANKNDFRDIVLEVDWHEEKEENDQP